MAQERHARLYRARVVAERRTGCEAGAWATSNGGRGLDRTPGCVRQRRAVLVELRRIGLSHHEASIACGASYHRISCDAVKLHEERTGETVVQGCSPITSEEEAAVDDFAALALPQVLLGSDADLLEQLRDAWLLFAACEEPKDLDTILELLDADAARGDPQYRRPPVMGEIRRTEAA